LKLAELRPWLALYRPEGIHRVNNLAEAQGIFFLCPACFRILGGSEGCHGLLIPFEGRGAPGGALWTVLGTSLADLTLTPSVLIFAIPETEETVPEWRGKMCRGWHGWIRVGEVVEA
jgi:hypothetical protein